MLPYPASERLVAIWGENPRQNFSQVNVSFLETERYRAAKSLEKLTAYRFSQVGLRAAGSPQSIQSVEVGDGFETLQE